MMKIIYAILIIFFLPGCQMKNTETDKMYYPRTFFVGTYTSGESRGIYAYRLLENGELQKIGLAAELDNPSFLAMTHDRKYLLAISEVSREDNEGSIVSYSVKEDSLVFISRTTSGGAHPCFVTVNRDGYVMTANYTGGNVGLVKMNDRGELSGLLDLQQHTGSGITDRQKGPHAHSAWFVPSGNEIISVDLGTNELWFSHLDTVSQKLIPAEPEKLSMAPGAGPRHLAFHPNGKWIYVVNELDCTVTMVLKGENGTYKTGSSNSTLPEDNIEANTCADIHVSPDGNFVYASNRGHNSIAIFKVNMKDGSLTAIGYQPVHGNWPRNFSLSPDGKFLLVANQKTHNIVSFRRDSSTGMLEYLNETEAPSPVCIVF